MGKKVTGKMPTMPHGFKGHTSKTSVDVPVKEQVGGAHAKATAATPPGGHNKVGGWEGHQMNTSCDHSGKS